MIQFCIVCSFSFIFYSVLVHIVLTVLLKLLSDYENYLLKIRSSDRSLGTTHLEKASFILFLPLFSIPYITHAINCMRSKDHIRAVGNPCTKPNKGNVIGFSTIVIKVQGGPRVVSRLIARRSDAHLHTYFVNIMLLSTI